VATTREKNKIKRKKKNGLFLEIIPKNKKLLFFLFLFQIYSVTTFSFQETEKEVGITKRIFILFFFRRTKEQKNKGI